MIIIKKWDLWYWIVVIIIVWIKAQEGINSPEYQWLGLGIFTMIWIAIGIYLAGKVIQKLLK